MKYVFCNSKGYYQRTYSEHAKKIEDIRSHYVADSH